MATENLAEWLLRLTITGREEDDDSHQEDRDEGNDPGNDGEGGSGGDSQDLDGDNGEDDDSGAAKLAAMEKALNEERKLRRKAERDARRASRRPESPPDSDPNGEGVEELKAKLSQEAEKGKRLAASLLRQKVDQAIREAAEGENFIDPTDALTDDIRRQVDADQDPEDPTDIDIDIESVTSAVKALARNKQHLVGKGIPGSRSGGKFRKGRDKDKGEDLGAHYPSLR